VYGKRSMARFPVKGDPGLSPLILPCNTIRNSNVKRVIKIRRVADLIYQSSKPKLNLMS